MADIQFSANVGRAFMRNYQLTKLYRDPNWRSFAWPIIIVYRQTRLLKKTGNGKRISPPQPLNI